jgi:protein O-GlcNAc transferase
MEARAMRQRVPVRVLGVSAALALTLTWAPPARADEAAGHYNLCLQYKREGKVPDAIAECQKAVQVRADYAAAHLSLGNLYRGQGDYAHAADEFAKTAKLQPKDATAHANLGAALVRLKKVDEGIKELEAALDLKPDDYETRV